MKYPTEYLSLGRREDIVQINEVKIVELNEESIEFEVLDENINYYIPIDKVVNNEVDTNATIYTLNKVYKKETVRKGVEFRRWEKSRVAYCVGGKNTIDFTEVHRDNDKKIVFLI